MLVIIIRFRNDKIIDIYINMVKLGKHDTPVLKMQNFIGIMLCYTLLVIFENLYLKILFFMNKDNQRAGLLPEAVSSTQSLSTFDYVERG